MVIKRAPHLGRFFSPCFSVLQLGSSATPAAHKAMLRRFFVDVNSSNKRLRSETMTKIKDVDGALKAFEDAASKYAEATEQGNYKLGNKCYSIVREAVVLLREQNQTPLLSQFLNHHSVGARIWAATYLLPIQEDESLKVLEQIAATSGIHSLTAATAVQEWKRNALNP
jgi:hypothetical protein